MDVTRAWTTGIWRFDFRGVDWLDAIPVDRVTYEVAAATHKGAIMVQLSAIATPAIVASKTLATFVDSAVLESTSAFTLAGCLVASETCTARNIGAADIGFGGAQALVSVKVTVKFVAAFRITRIAIFSIDEAIGTLSRTIAVTLTTHITRGTSASQATHAGAGAGDGVRDALVTVLIRPVATVFVVVAYSAECCCTWDTETLFAMQRREDGCATIERWALRSNSTARAYIFDAIGDALVALAALSVCAAVATKIHTSFAFW